MATKIFGYARVSTKNQNEERQIFSLQNCGLAVEEIFIDKKTGENFNRPNYRKLLKKISAGDVLVISSLDRLGRNYDELLEQWKFLTQKKRVKILVLDMPFLQTTGSENDITQNFLNDLFLKIFSYVAEIERKNIRQRQLEGIELAKKRGVKFGRPRKEKPKNFSSVCAKYQEKKISSRRSSELLGISQSVFLKWYHEEFLQKK